MSLDFPCCPSDSLQPPAQVVAVPNHHTCLTHLHTCSRFPHQLPGTYASNFPPVSVGLSALVLLFPPVWITSFWILDYCAVLLACHLVHQFFSSTGKSVYLYQRTFTISYSLDVAAFVT